jgi:predicted helicase
VWTKVNPVASYYFFSPHDFSGRDEYESAPKISEWMSVNSPGVETSRDGFAVAFDKEELEQRMADLCSDMPSRELRKKYGLDDKRDWQLPKARRTIKRETEAERAGRIIPYCYRPFDERRLYYSDSLVTWPRHAVQDRMLRPNVALITVRNSRDRRTNMFYASRLVTDKSVISSLDTATVFPLYLYPSNKGDSLSDDNETADAHGGRRPNLSDAFIADFAARLLMSFVADGRGDRVLTFGPEDVFAYMYAVFHSPTYRSRYAEFLKVDFPRLPLTSDAELFDALCKIGDSLLAVHLLENFPSPVTTYPASGTNEVEQVGYTAPGGEDSADGRVWINEEQFFAGVPEEVWNFYVGGYQVASKWLKDRKGRALTYEEITHYQNVVAALGETLRLMSAIDAEIEQRGGWPLE